MGGTKGLKFWGCRAGTGWAATLVSLTAMACSTTAGPDPTGDPGPDPDVTPAPWSQEAISIQFSETALRAGSLGGQTLHCSGPLHDASEYEDYVTAYAELPPAMWVTYYSLLDNRFTPAERLVVLEGQLDEYGGIPFLGISYTSSNPDGSSTGWDPQVAAGDRSCPRIPETVYAASTRGVNVETSRMYYN